ncbi:MAG: hypothetical protein LBU09_05490 [Endomicrobium sp.]|nr:hypothetical protein [Endomicrobium sp.]
MALTAKNNGKDEYYSSLPSALLFIPQKLPVHEVAGWRKPSVAAGQ